MSQGVIYQDAAGRVISANAAACQILGVTLEQLQGRGSEDSHGKAIHEDGSEFSSDRHPSYVASMTGQAVKDVIMGFFNQNEDVYRWVSVCAMPQFRPGELRPFQTYITLSDITDLKHAQEALISSRDELGIKVKERTRELAESEEKYRKLVENANEAIFVSQDQKSKLFNSKALELFGYTKEELEAKTLLELVYPEDRDLVNEQYTKRITGKDLSASYEHRILCNDGGIKWVAVNAVMISWESRPASLVLLTDITAHKNMEQELKAYAQRITQVQEEERKRVAYELHDDTVQYLSILKLQLDYLINSGKIQDPEISEKLVYLEKDAARAVDDVRRYSHELRPGVLEHLGLQAALEQIAEDVNKFNQVAVEVDTEGEEPGIPEEVKLGFFRIAQEALNNARKHADASRINISIQFTGSCVKLAVTDNGIGFDIQQAAVRTNLQGNLGLMSMRERAKLIGADLNIESEIGKGTTVTAEIKL
jgi:PAS domain S-box-containing protein